MARVVLVSHRLPVPGGPAAPSGLLTALTPGMEALGGLWMGWSGRCTAAADRRLVLKARGNVEYALLDLTPAEHRRHYAGFCNQALWPLLHGLNNLVRCDARDYDAYRSVNRIFASRLAPLLRSDDRVWINDYHLLPLGTELRTLSVRNRIGFFLHTPCPGPVMWAALPMRDALLDTLRAYDLIGMQTGSDADCLRLLLDTAVDTTAAKPRLDRIKAFPASIDAGAVAALALESRQKARSGAPDHAYQRVLGVDRLDPAKGALHRLAGFGAFLREHAERCGRTQLLQVIPDSRSAVPGYLALRTRLDRCVAVINARYRRPGWTPVRTVTNSLAAPALAGLYRTAQVALLTPLRDGMNLVAKEYVAAQDPDDPGVLILSCHAGAARELAGALLIDPEDAGGIAQALERALTMPLAERRQRWRGMYRHLLAHDALRWYADFLAALDSAPRIPSKRNAGGLTVYPLP